MDWTGTPARRPGFTTNIRPSRKFFRDRAGAGPMIRPIRVTFALKHLYSPQRRRLNNEISK